MPGSAPGNSTSTTGPMTWTILPLFILDLRNFATGSFPLKERKIYGHPAASVKDGSKFCVERETQRDEQRVCPTQSILSRMRRSRFFPRNVWLEGTLLRCYFEQMSIITAKQLHQQTKAVLNQLEQGESLLITRNGRTIGRIEPLAAAEQV